MMCCCRLRCLHMSAFFSSFPSILFYYLFLSNTQAEQRNKRRDEREREKEKHNCVYMCIKKHKKKIFQQQNVHIFPYFFSRTFSRKETKKKAKKERERKKKWNKNNFMLMYLHGSYNKNYVYMWCLLHYMIHISSCSSFLTSSSSSSSTSSSSSHSLLSMVLCVIFSDILSFISNTHNGNCLYYCSSHRKHFST